jgi:hypothetical protein
MAGNVRLRSGHGVHVVTPGAGLVSSMMRWLINSKLQLAIGRNSLACIFETSMGLCGDHIVAKIDPIWISEAMRLHYIFNSFSRNILLG